MPKTTKTPQHSAKPSPYERELDVYSRLSARYHEDKKLRRQFNPCPLPPLRGVRASLRKKEASGHVSKARKGDLPPFKPLPHYNYAPWEIVPSIEVDSGYQSVKYPDLGTPSETSTKSGSGDDGGSSEPEIKQEDSENEDMPDAFSRPVWEPRSPSAEGRGSRSPTIKQEDLNDISIWDIPSLPRPKAFNIHALLSSPRGAVPRVSNPNPCTPTLYRIPPRVGFNQVHRYKHYTEGVDGVDVTPLPANIPLGLDKFAPEWLRRGEKRRFDPVRVGVEDFEEGFGETASESEGVKKLRQLLGRRSGRVKAHRCRNLRGASGDHCRCVKTGWQSRMVDIPEWA